ncbi:MAG: hypothetical protein LBJ18_01495, partial [Rickettsiales bacterium]|nr:hypothetical protein [Rickettsiales bacterium]
MIILKKIFNKKTKSDSGHLYSLLSTLYSAPAPQARAQSGAMMTELLLSIALAAAMLPFILRSERTQELRTKNIAAAEQLSNVKSALENYMDAHKKELLTPIGRNITRVKISDLDGFGVSAEILENHPDDFQMRILKSPDRGGKPTLQGLVIMTGADITPLRTREIATLSGNAAGFIDNGKAFGAFGTWRAGTGDFGGGLKDGVLETTTVKRGGAEYLWRLPSENASDATLASNMNMGGHDLIGAKFLDSSAFRMEEYLNANTVVSDKLIFQNRTTLE